MDKNRNYNWLIIQGCPRSGTKILTKILNTHKNIALTYEFNLLKNDSDIFLKKIKTTSPEKNHVVYFGDKLPDYSNHNKKLKNKFKNLKIIHISRNPLNVINSMMGKTKDAKEGKNIFWNPFLSINDACSIWISSWNAVNQHQDIFHLKYEDLIKNPWQEIKKISEFLNVENQFDISAVEKNQKPITLSEDEIKIINSFLAKIIKEWNAPIESLKKEFPIIKNLSFPRTRRIIKSELWALLKAYRNINETKNSNIP